MASNVGLRLLLCGSLLCLSLMVLVPRAGADDPEAAEAAALEQDYRDIAGSWQRKITGKDGREVTVTKLESNQRSIVIARDEKGQVLHEHQSDFELLRTGKVRIFRYSNRTVTQGPQTGEVQPGPFEYIYRIDKDRFIEIHGLLIDQTRSPNVIVWKRVENAPGGDL